MLLFIFVAALGAFEPGESVEFTAIVVALAALWLARVAPALARQAFLSLIGRPPRTARDAAAS